MSLGSRIREKIEKGLQEFFYEPGLYILQIFVGFVICFVIFCFLQMIFG